MHELSLTQSILQIANDEAARSGATQIKAIHLKVGALTGVQTEAIQFYLDTLSKGTVAEGVKLEAEHVPVGATCGECGRFFIVEDYDLTCPDCGAMAKITQGKELSVVSLEVEK